MLEFLKGTHKPFPNAKLKLWSLHLIKTALLNLNKDLELKMSSISFLLVYYFKKSFSWFFLSADYWVLLYGSF